MIAAALSVGGESPGSPDVGPNFAFLLLAAAATGYVLMTAAIYIRMLLSIVFERQRARPRPGGGRGALATVVLAAILSIVGGVWPAPAIEYLYQLQTSLERGTRRTNAGSSPEPTRQTDPNRQGQRKGSQ